ncbi:MAG: anthranilate phosphoribosyltransferase [Chthoniobacterales bacterium]|nr:anthranilate phosphoribosyltransferase [Chthoniobacterales bacterium]
MQGLIEKVRSGAELDEDDIAIATVQLISATVDDALKADFLAQLHERGETAGEIGAFVRQLLARAKDPGIDLASLSGPAIDVCGTGGDGLDLFNVSTTIMFILAAGGAVVLKHGNRSVTSCCGSADVLEELGVSLVLEAGNLRHCIEDLGLCFLFARHYHPVFRALAATREHLARRKTRTIFNLLGPLLNPARPPRQLLGVYASRLTRVFAQVLQKLGRERAWVVYGRAENGAGMDDLSVCGASTVAELKNGEIATREVESASAGVSLGTLAELRGGDRAENAALLIGILAGEIHGAKREMTLLNAGAGFVIAGVAETLPAGVALAREQIESGRALARLRALQNFTA